MIVSQAVWNNGDAGVGLCTELEQLVRVNECQTDFWPDFFR